MKKFNYDNIVKQYTDMTEPTEPPDLPNPPPDQTPTIIYCKNILLIDKRVQSYDTIVAATDPSLCIPILFDYYQDTIEDIKQRIIANVEIPQPQPDTNNNNNKFSFQSIGIVQHNMRRPTYNLVDNQLSTEPASTEPASTEPASTEPASTCIIFDVSNADPQLHTWAPLRDFMLWCKTEYSIQYFDMMACALYADPNWKYVIDNLEILTNVNIRASIDDTGSATMGGDWFLETDEISLKDVYFTDEILNYTGILSDSFYAKFLIDLSGRAWGLGNNDAQYGRFGIGSTTGNFTSKQLISTVTGIVTKVSTGSYNTAFLTSDGNVWTCGRGDQYQLCSGSTTTTLTALKVTNQPNILNSIIDVKLDNRVTILLKNDGTVWACGWSNSNARFGVISNVTAGYITIPTQITGLSNIKNIEIAGNDEGPLFCITNTGLVYVVGAPSYGLIQSHYGLGGTPLTNPQLLTDMSNVIFISSSYNRSIALLNDGTAYTCGYNVNGELGLGHTNAVNKFTKMPNASGFTNTNIVLVAAGDGYGLFLKTDGTVYGCGWNDNGRCGLGATLYITTPTLITDLNGINIVSVSTNAQSSYFLSNTGNIYCCGYNNYGSLGLGDTSSRTTPTLIPGGALWKSLGNGMASTITNFTNITKTNLDISSSFTITAPTSNSNGAFTYTSSNPTVATITSGGVYTILSIGSTTITITQAASGIYESSTKTITLTVKTANPITNFQLGPRLGYYATGDSTFTITDTTSNYPSKYSYTSDNSGVAYISSTVESENALNFDGVDDQVRFTNYPSTTNLTTAFSANQVALEMWIKPTGTYTGLQNFFFMERSGGNYPLRIGRDGTTNKLTISYVNYNSGSITITSNSLVNYNQWTHIAFVGSAAGGVSANAYSTLYINGIIDISSGLQPSANTNIWPIDDTGVTLGKSVGGGTGNNGIPCLIKKFKLWNITRLSGQIYYSYITDSIHSSETRPIIYTKFNQGVGGGINTDITVPYDEYSSGIRYWQGVLNNFALTGTTSNWVFGDVVGSATVTLVKAGTTNITVSGTETTYYGGATATLPLNVYSYPTTITNFQLGPKSGNYTFADASFALTTPISNNASSFIYTVDNSNAAYIGGSDSNGSALFIEGVSSTNTNSVTFSTNISFPSLSFTIEFWLFPTKVNPSQQITIINTPNVCISLDSNQTIRLLQYNIPGSTYSIYTTNKIPLNTWSHIAVTNNYIFYKIYINGNFSFINTDYYMINILPPANITSVTVGTGAGLGFEGAICDFRMWNTERTASQIFNNYRQPLVGNETGLVMYNRFNGDASSNLTSGLYPGTNNVASTLKINIWRPGLSCRWMPGPFGQQYVNFFEGGTSNVTVSQISQTGVTSQGVTLPLDSVLDASSATLPLTVQSTITNFTLGPKSGNYFIADASFVITKPSSVSTVPFTYSSSNTSVATASIISSTKALLFDGTSTYIDWPWTTGQLAVLSLTIELWIYPTSYMSSQRTIWASSGQASIALKSDGTLNFSVTIGGSNAINISSTYVIPLNTWTHIAVVRNDNGFDKIYINGVLHKSLSEATQYITQNLTPNSSWVRLGMPTNGGMAGQMCDLRFWTTVRTADQILSNYLYQTPLIGNETGLFIYERLNGAVTSNASSMGTLTWVPGITGQQGLVTILKDGSSNITVSQAASTIPYYTAKSATALLTVTKQTQVLSNFTIPTKRYADASFALTDPSSNVNITNPFYKYTSNNTNVATITADLSVNAVNFDGGDYSSGDYILIGTPAILQDVSGIGFRKNMTIECWFKTNGTLSKPGTLISKNITGGATTSSTFNIQVAATTGIIGFSVTNNSNNAYYRSTTGTSYSDSNWHHVAVSYDSSGGVMKIYADGINVFTDSSSSFGLLAANTVRVLIGSDDGGQSPYTNSDRQFNGSICEVRFWSVVRTDSQIYNNYRRILAGNETGLIGYLRLNQGVASGTNTGLTTATNNMVTGGFTGTLTNFALSGTTSNWVTGVSTIRPVNDVNIVGLGSTTITATQASTTTYTDASINAILNVIPAIPTLSNFTISNKNITDASFTLVDPSSNSTGAFSYSVVGAPTVSISGKKVTFLTTGITTIRATQSVDTSGNFTTNYIDASFSIGVGIVTSFTYSIGAAGVAGSNTGNGLVGGTTTATINGQVLTAYGGAGGLYQNSANAVGGLATGGTNNVQGGYGTGAINDTGGGAGGSINGGNPIEGASTGDDAANVTDYQGLAAALAGQPIYFLGIGGLRSATHSSSQINNGRPGTGIGAGGGGTSYYGGNGGNGSFGGGGGGGGGYTTTTYTGGTGGQGVIVLRINDSSTVILTSGTSYNISSGSLLKMWVIGAGGGGGGATNVDATSGGGGGAGGMAYYSYTVPIAGNQITLTASPSTPSTIISKFILNDTISFGPFVTNNTDGGYTLSHVSQSTSVVTIPVATTASARIAGSGVSVIYTTISATANFPAYTTGVYTIAVIGNNTTYSSITMQAADLSNCNITGSTFTSCDFSGVNLYGVTIDASTNLSTCTLTNLRSGGITGTTAQLPANYTIMNGYIVGPYVNLSGADLSNLDFSGVNFTGANFTGAVLTGANLTNTNFTGANFTNVNMDVANVNGANFTNVNFTSAYLAHMNFSNANITNANFTNANTSSVNAPAGNNPNATPTIYYRNPGVLSDFSVPTKRYLDASFALVYPSSTNTNYISFSSSNTNIATITSDLSVNAVNFDGGDSASGDYILVDTAGIPTILQDASGLGFRKNMTIECWFKTQDTSAQKSFACLISKTITGGTSSTGTFELYMNVSGQLGFYLTNNSNTAFSKLTTASYNDATWHHAALTYNSTGGLLKGYIDGSNVISDSSGSFGLLASNTVKVMIGSADGGQSPNTQTNRQFKGSICECRFWAVERTAAQIYNNYRRILAGNETGLGGYLRLNSS
jgi:uncharacterized protein YjbI with pentapeptide repeats/alpha-tubulin suppressor-like RCC1 family protein